MTDIAAFIYKDVQDIPATSSRTVTTYIIYRATTMCSWAFWRTESVKTMDIENTGHIVLGLTMMHGQQSLMLCWCSFARWGKEHVAFSFSYKGSQYCVYDCLPLVAPQTTQDTQPTIIYAHIQDGVGRVSHSVSRIDAAGDAFVTVYNVSADWSPRMGDQKLLTLCWRSSSCIVLSKSSAINNYINDYFDLLVAFLSDWDSARWQSRAR